MLPTENIKLKNGEVFKHFFKKNKSSTVWAVGMKLELAFLVQGSVTVRQRPYWQCPLLTSASPAQPPRAVEGSAGQAGKSLTFFSLLTLWPEPA